MRSVLSLSLGSFPGASRALIELAACTGLTHHLTVEPTGGAVRRFALDLLAGHRVRLLVVGGWSRAYRPFVTAAAAAGIPVAVCWTSSGAQVEIGRELRRFEEVLSDRRIQHRWFLQRSLADALGPAVPGVAWLPSLSSAALSASTPQAHPPRRAANRVAQVGLFSSPHEYHRKNVLNTLLALSRVARPVRLHLNGLSAHADYKAWLTRLPLRYVDHGWMPAARYRALVRRLDLGLQPSLAESFNHVAVDHLLARTPILVSPMVPAIADRPLAVRRPFVVSRPDDAAALTGAIDALLGTAPRQLADQVEALRSSFIASQRRALREAVAVVTRALEPR